MKSFSFSLLFACLSVITNAQVEPYYHGSRYSNPNSPATISNESTGYSGTGANMDVLYHKIYWRINPDSIKYIKGWVQTNFKTIQDNVSSVSFDLRSVLMIDSVVFRNAQLPAANITRTGNVVSVNLGTTLSNNFIDSFIVYYQGVPPAVSGAAQGYQKSTNSGAGNYITTLSESYEDRDWWPCKADMQDKIDSMDIIVNVPWGNPTVADTFWVACNGKLTDSTITGNNRSFVFKNRYPTASYLVFVSVAKYNRYYNSVNVSGTEVPVVYNLFRGKTAATYTSIITAMDKMNPLLVEFSNKFGDYPFKNEKHGFYDGLLGASGMEHQTFSGIATSSLTSLRTLGHELAHQWFGDNVSFATWNDLWLAEGFARYGEALSGELVPSLGINPYSTRSAFKSSALSSSVSAWIPDGNIANSDLIWNTGYGSAVYERGAMIVSMLRAIAGDAIFYQALTNFQTALNGKSATADSLKNHFNALLGRDISVFFNDYVGGSGNGAVAVGGRGYPTNTINWNSPSANKLVVQPASQTQSSGSNVSYFRGPVALHVKGSLASQDTTINFFDWGSGNLSFAGNGLSAPVAGGKLSYNLSFTPTSVLYDDSARTMSTGSTVYVPTLNDGGFSFTTPSPATASCPASASMDVILSTASINGFSNTISLSAVSGVPSGTSVSFIPASTVTPGGSITVRLTGTNTLSAGTYNITVQGAATGATTQTVIVTYNITSGTGPTINSQPSDQVVCSGNNATFSITSPAATNFQWQVSTDGGTTWTNTGTTTASITLSAVTTAMNTNQYRCIASSVCGNTSSNAAVLTVNTPAGITAQPADGMVCSGSSFTFCTSATGTGLTYQWQSAPTCAGPWVNVAGAISACLTVNNATATTSYRCSVTSSACGNTATSNCVLLTIIAPVTVTLQPANTELCSGSNATFTVAGNSTQSVAYQWQVSTDGGNSFTNIAGATATTYTANNTISSQSGYRYRCLLSNTTCPIPVASNAGILTVRQLPSVGLAASPLASLLPGQITTLTATPGVSTGGSLSFVWLYNTSPLAATGNTYIVNVEKAGIYLARIQEAWPGGLLCTAQSPIVTIEAPASNKLFIFPSPNDGRFTVSYYNNDGASTVRLVKVFDSKGSVVYSRQFNISGSYTLLNIDLQGVNTGIFYVVIGDAGGNKLSERKVHIR
ncbi:MAG: T9SS type A sorting domain-containing protein [Chitinophagaceae bacterium]|nr:T9SS type A sorting domain-containing protein [Chitinophagaceae bacterium]